MSITINQGIRRKTDWKNRSRSEIDHHRHNLAKDSWKESGTGTHYLHEEEGIKKIIQALKASKGTDY